MYISKNSVQNVMKFHGAKGNLLSKLENPNVEDKFDILVDANDQLLERIVSFIFHYKTTNKLFSEKLCTF